MRESIFTMFDIDINKNAYNFIEKLSCKKRNVDLKYEENSEYVLGRINNRLTRQDVIKSLIDMDFNFNKPFPYEFLRDSFPVLNTVNENLVKEKTYYSYYIDKGESYRSFNGLKVVFLKTDKVMTPYVFRLGFDIVVNNKSEGEWIISLSPDLQEEYSLENIYRKLNGQEEGNWSLQYKKTVLKGRNSVVYTRDLKKYIREFKLNR